MNFSIIIPLYNKQAAIRRAMQSVIQQLSPNDELIVVDDGSTDSSLNAARLVQSEHPSSNIVVHSQENGGVSAARNKGVRLASHELVTFLDADDTYEAIFLNEIKALIQQFPRAAMFSTAYRFIYTATNSHQEANLTGLHKNKVHQILGDFFHSAATGDLPITSSSVCIKKSALMNIGGFPEGENMGEDQAVWSQLALKHPIAISKRIAANYYADTSDSLMQTVAPSHEMPFSVRLQEQLDQQQTPKHLSASIQNYIASHLLDLVRRNIAAGSQKNALRLLADPRTRLQLTRWCYWSAKVRFIKIYNFLDRLIINFDGVGHRL